MTLRFIKDVIFRDQNDDTVKIKKGKILSANLTTDEEGKSQYEITYKKNVFIVAPVMENVMFEVL